MMKGQERPAIGKELTTVQVGLVCSTNVGVDSFRRFVTDIGSVHNPEYDIDISESIPKIADYGNIKIEPTVDDTLDDEGNVIARKLIKPTME